jgi:hypothetical protein
MSRPLRSLYCLTLMILLSFPLVFAFPFDFTSVHSHVERFVYWMKSHWNHILSQATNEEKSDQISAFDHEQSSNPLNYPRWYPCPNAPLHWTFDPSLSSVTLLDRLLQVNFTGSADAPLQDGTLEIAVIYSKARIYSTSQSLSNGLIPFPLPSAGDFHYQESIIIPSAAPKGDYEIIMQFVNQLHQILGCIVVEFQLENEERNRENNENQETKLKAWDKFIKQAEKSQEWKRA